MDRPNTCFHQKYAKVKHDEWQNEVCIITSKINTKEEVKNEEMVENEEEVKGYEEVEVNQEDEQEIKKRWVHEKEEGSKREVDKERGSETKGRNREVEKEKRGGAETSGIKDKGEQVRRSH